MCRRADLRGNYLHAASAAIRKATTSAYGDSASGSIERIQIVEDLSHRDKDGKRMADVRFQLCILAWYTSIRRVDARMLDDFQDITKLGPVRSWPW